MGYIPGDYWAVCEVCTHKYYASELRERWDHKMVCPEDWETRHPQEFLKVQKDPPGPLPFISKEGDGVDVTFGSIQGFSWPVPTGTFDETTAYILTPGQSGQMITTPDTTSNSIAGDIDVRLKMAFNDWTPTNDKHYFGKYVVGGNQRSWLLSLSNTLGRLMFRTSADGISSSTRNCTADLNLIDGDTIWVRVTLDVDNGASGNDVKFWTSDDGITWTQLGSTITNAGVTTIFDSTAPITVGGYTSIPLNETVAGKFYYAEVRNGIDGPVVALMDAKDATEGYSTFTSGSTSWTMIGNLHVEREQV